MNGNVKSQLDGLEHEIMMAEIKKNMLRNNLFCCVMQEGTEKHPERVKQYHDAYIRAIDCHAELRNIQIGAYIIHNRNEKKEGKE